MHYSNAVILLLIKEDALVPPVPVPARSTKYNVDVIRG